MKKYLFIFTLLLLGAFTSLHAQTICANSLTGDDATGDGSNSNPYKTFYKAYSAVSSGGSISLSGTFDWTDADEIGDVTEDGFLISKDITIFGQGANITTVQADPNPSTADRRVFHIDENITVSFKDLTIRHGYASFNAAGGAIGSTDYIVNNLLLTNCNIIDNYGNGVPGIYCRGSFIAYNSCFNNNVSAYDGSAVELYIKDGIDSPQRIIVNCTFYNNKYNEVYFNHAAALFVDRTAANIVNCTFSNNTAGIIVYGCSSSEPTYITNTIVHNSDIHDILCSYSSNSVYVNNSIYGELATGADYYSPYGFASEIACTQIADASTIELGAITNGGYDFATYYMPLGATSIAIGAGATGTTGTAAGGSGLVDIPTSDQRNAPFTGAPSIGSYTEGGTPLPVELISFTAEKTSDNKVRLDWVTASEKNNDFFTIEKSSDVNSWEELTIIGGAGNSNQILNYTSNDHNPNSGITYYRLKQTDYDGQYSYSDIVYIDGISAAFDVYPSPAKNNITIQAEENSIENIVITNMLGQDVTDLTKISYTSGTIANIDISALTNGLYLVKTENYSGRFIKN